ncbi:probable ATP-dependent RNA helicase DHX34 [Limulus polyphemus]|uniref:Probable ATP-dependent RNA helicase DHX34 n=1 Tax=Limulus polyphemus TaxID=6850 RepID=A0ABM1BCV9_LIMPO|nr:probable ATP-dependent RNA helicase DHX34 [Limulus polyphemus]
MGKSKHKKRKKHSSHKDILSDSDEGKKVSSKSKHGSSLCKTKAWDMEGSERCIQDKNKLEAKEEATSSITSNTEAGGYRKRSSENHSEGLEMRKKNIHRDGHTSKYLDQNEPVDFENHRAVLNKMFFGDKDIIKRGSTTYDDFWIFLQKYQAMQMNAGTLKSHSVLMGSTQSGESSMGVPKLYSKHHKINFNLKTDDVRELMCRGHIFKDEDETDQLTEADVIEFKQILLLYVNFLQKQKFSKLRKLREAQANLPISKYAQDIVHAVKSHQVIVVAGDTGCGKSTQVPQYLLAAGFQKIACTQPRRIACISLCKRVAYETLNEYGSEVAYQIRFEKSKTQHTRILFLTEGLLLRQVASDPLLSSYDIIILDEVHERHLSCDFLLGVVKCLMIQRPNLKVILMSATINIQLYTEYFGNCPVIQVPGRLFPIEVFYRPTPAEERCTQTGRMNPNPYIQIMQLIDSKYPSGERGDLLIFLSGMTEISTLVEAATIYAEQTQKWIILPLHSTLSLAEQDKVFDYPPEGVRKCIISTNIAETSVTIDGVRFVVDSGKVKEMSYDATYRMQRLQEFCISRASAEQRKGRAGRTGPGVCYRLFSEKEYEALSPYSTPEIQRVPLDSLILQMISMGLPDARKFPFLEAPPADSLEESIQSLKDQAALTDEEMLTPMGQMLACLPVDVTIGKILVLGSVFHLVDPVLSLAATLSVQSPFTNRSYRDPDKMAARRSLESDHGDPFTLLSAYHKWLEVKSNRHESSRKWCNRHGLEEQRFYEITKLRRQFKDLLQNSGLMERKLYQTSSSRRVQRYGELRQLREMKRQFQQTPHQRKMLRLVSDIEGIVEEGAEEDVDIKDVEFRMSNDCNQVQALLSTSNAYTHKDLVMLKLIVASGLYPQVAVADEHNSYKSDSDQLFHTKAKPFVMLHPMSVLALQPDLLQLREMDVEQMQGFTSRTPLSMKHQLLTYLLLLETTKPYLVNCLRVPAAHSLLLLSHSLDTNQDFTRIVCDGWLELRFVNGEGAQQFVLQAIRIRDLWEDVLQNIFQETVSTPASDHELSREVRKKQQTLPKLLDRYLHLEVLHTIRRLLAADLKELYIGSEDFYTSEGTSYMAGVFGEVNEYRAHPKKGGLVVKTYLTYNCILDVDQTTLQYIQKPWLCPKCHQELTLSVLDQVRHQEQCQANENDEEEAQKRLSMNSLKKAFFCSECQEELFLTSTEMLRHKKSHMQQEKV